MKRTGPFLLKTGLLTLVIVFCICCKKKKSSGSDEPETTFDKQGMLVNMADNVVLPCYRDFKTALDSLVATYDVFALSGSQADFQAAKQKLHVAYLKYQRVSLFGFGPGEDQSIRSNFNVFPCNTTLINANISSGTYNFSSLTNIAAKGFPALDYLFYGLNAAETDQIDLFKTSANRKKYVSDILKDMSDKISSVISTWNSSYRNSFVSSLGTDVGSSIGFLINQINYELDYLKNAKIGIPLGLKSAGTILPESCEAYYGQQSVQYALETLTILEHMYLGKSFSGNDGKGFDDYLDHLGIMHIDQTLNAAIKAQFLNARAKLSLVGNPLSDQIINNPAVVNTAYKELVKLLVLLKTDMPSNLGVVITYQDGDGD